MVAVISKAADYLEGSPGPGRERLTIGSVSDSRLEWHHHLAAEDTAHLGSPGKECFSG